MKWYKHDSNANCDARLRKVRLKYGMEGYGLYWYCLELIAQNIEEHNLSFELEHDAEIISADTGIHYEVVQEMMEYMIDLGLFEQNAGVITCFKMLKRLDQSMTSNKHMRQLIHDAKKSHDIVMTKSGFIMEEESRVEEKRVDKNRLNVLGAKRAPKSFAVSKKMAKWAETECGFSVERVGTETSAFMDHEFRVAKKDWPAVWRNWMRKSAEWGKSREAKSVTDPYYAEMEAYANANDD